MPDLRISLFGKLAVRCDGRPLDGLASSRAQELLAYLVLRPGRRQPREALAELLWSESTPAQAKKNLRQALWQLQTAFEPARGPAGEPLLRLDTDWLSLNPDSGAWFDVLAFEQACAPLRGLPGRALNAASAQQLADAAALYTADLLEGWYHDWCVFERERLQSLYLALLDKLVVYCELSAQYEQGIVFAETALRYDRADERTHRRLMSLHYLLGDRTAALRQYQRCRQALHSELGVRPARLTEVMHEQIRLDLLGAALPPPSAQPASPLLLRTLSRLNEIHDLVATMRSEIEHDALPVDAGTAVR